jgi:cysteine desulfurase
MSTNRRIYLDFNATAPLVPAARDAITAALAHVGNPSSIHAEGRAMRQLVEQARTAVADLVGRARDRVVLTSGGTEANALGVLGLAAVVEQRCGPRVAVGSPIDHPSLRGALAALAPRGWEVRWMPVDPAGVPAVDRAAAALVGAGLAAWGHVNHELGTVADTAALAAAARAAGALVHVDAVQAAGKLALGDVPADALALSGHKLGAPPGVGAVIVARDEGLPLIDGGHQERGRRPGTENVLGAVGLGAAAQAARPAEWPAVAALGDRLERGLLAIGGVCVHGAAARRVGGTVNAGFAGARGDAIAMALDLAGVATSTGAACTSGSVQPSPVLLALGVPPRDARGAVRFSLGRVTSADEIDAVLALLPAIVARARAHGPR